ncbi:hypothetical protein [Staphylococcus epidermidis]|uniref:hypothetical protein n=1 Tax=Staphylococcus epidermidis TaxID=1282 RepID=UPI0016428549|nr:hypothetical protein [Staphylococcus epidermidis]
MLKVRFNLGDGRFSEIVDDGDELMIEGYEKLRCREEVLLKGYIMKDELDI